MLTVEQALGEVRRRAGPLPARRRRLGDAQGCVLAEDVTADRDSPPFDKSLVDGFAVRSEDLREGGVCRLSVVEEITAGRTPTRALAAGESAAIMTGAPLPPGADAVVMIEGTRCPEPGMVEIEDLTLAPGAHWMARGREMRAGEVVLRRGERLDPARLGLLASVGRAEVLVVPRPRVAVLPTGDELVEPDQVPGPGQIRNSNATMLRALALECGVEAEALPIVPDEPRQLGEALRLGLAADVLLVTGGVSAGNRDLVPGALEALGVERAFHKVRIKPGKPLWFGVGPEREDGPGTLVFGLPGNPVSGVVGFLLFVRLALEILRGRPGAGPAPGGVRLATPFRHRGDRPTYHPSRWVAADDDGPTVEPLDWAGSADLRTVARADGFAVFPAGDRDYPAGGIVDWLPMG
jgi:molybdopterin molybdotransferase